jgi:hypothetical protein
MRLPSKYVDLLVDNNMPQAVLFDVFDSATLERGFAYLEGGKVGPLQFANKTENVSVHAKVRGSGGQTYATTVSFNSRSPLWITGVCTCPVRMACKHSVAVLFAYLQEAAKQKRLEILRKGSQVFTAASLPTARSRTLDPIEYWLQSLASSNAPTPVFHASPAPPPPQAQLVYLLHNDPHKSGLVTLGLYKSSLLKKGGLGKPAAVALDTLVSIHRARSFQYSPHDLMIAQLLALPDLRFSPYWHSGALTGKTGEQVLEEALKTGRLFWATPESWQHDIAPLRDGGPRHFQIEWLTNKASEYTVTVVASLPVTSHFWVNGQLWYADYPNHECGQLHHPELSQGQVEKLLNAPPIPEAQAERVSERLLELLPDADIPAPSPKARQQIEEFHAELQPSLLLHDVELGDDQRIVHVASLSFDYAGHVLRSEPGNSTLVRKADKRYRIQRDKAAELEAIDLLGDYGFEPARMQSSQLQALDMLMRVESKTLGALRWHDFLEHGISDLEQQGWQVVIDGNFALRFDVVDNFDASWEESGNDWFEISLGFEVDGQRINLLPILVEMLTQVESPQALRELLQRQEQILVPISDTRWVKLDSKRLESIMETLVELYDHQPLNADGNLELSKYQGANLAALLNDPAMKWKGAEELLQLTQKLKDFSGIQTIDLPEGLSAELRHYQHQGINWLQFLREYQFNGTLADDMGLGKTLQTLAHLLIEKQSGRMDLPSLVIAPTSLMGNWRREAARFTPDLRVQVIHGADRLRHFGHFHDYDLLLTTYPLIVRDEELYQKQSFHYLILDEAQAIKNALAKTTQAIHTLKARHRLCLTGTPMENHLGEVWSMYHFLMPGFLGAHEKFTRLFRTPIEKMGDGGRQHQLRNRIQPFMLRRTKELVASELPAKTEIIRSVSLTGKQRDLYETVRLAMDKKVQEEISKKGLARSHIMILDALLKLRQVCCDPRLVKLEKAQKVKESAKLELLMTLLPEMLEEGRKVLLFSQFTSMLALIEEAITQEGIRYSKLTGQTRNRDDAIAAFQEGDAQVFLISLKAGGTGLNLTAADTVIHYDPWWNPAAEQQATDRAYRIGQDKPVFVYKLITEDTVEEKILKLQEKKQALADGLYSDKEADTDLRFSADDLMDLLKPLENG